MPFNQDEFRRVMRRWASAVAIVTTRLDDKVHGLSVSGFVGVSLDPPLALVSIGHDQHSHDWIQKSGCYAVNFLRADQSQLSDRFAGRLGDEVDRFAGVAYRAVASGAPILMDCLAWFDCRIASTHIVGDHTLFIGEILAGDVTSDAAPLIYFDGDYRPVLIQAEVEQSRKP